MMVIYFFWKYEKRYVQGGREVYIFLGVSAMCVYTDQYIKISKGKEMQVLQRNAYPEADT